MFARRLSVQLKPNKFAEFTKTFEKDVLPLLRRQEGFQDEITFAAPDGIEVLAISLWDTRKHAETYNGSVYKDVLKILGSMIAGTPEVGTTEVMHSTFHHIRASVPVA
jgi:heme-degrading monooxygenase HmoA